VARDKARKAREPPASAVFVSWLAPIASDSGGRDATVLLEGRPWLRSFPCSLCFSFLTNVRTASCIAISLFFCKKKMNGTKEFVKSFVEILNKATIDPNTGVYNKSFPSQ
jgi:hypothetical protein